MKKFSYLCTAKQNKIVSMLTESERLQKIMETEQMTAKQFSEEVGIQPGTISNILKGRNKPSLEVMQKVLQRFRTLSSDWLISGLGSMYRQISDSQQPTLFDVRPETVSLPEDLAAQDDVNPASAAQPKQRKVRQEVPVENIIERKVQKVVVFYDDGTYEEISR